MGYSVVALVYSSLDGAYIGDTAQFGKTRNILRIIVDVSILDRCGLVLHPLASIKGIS